MLARRAWCGDDARCARESSTCIYDRKSRSLEPSSSAILHRTIFMIACSLFKFFITVHLPLHRTRAEGHHLHRVLRQVQFLLLNYVLHIEYIDLDNFAR
jgi:hypothetical protein